MCSRSRPSGHGLRQAAVFGGATNRRSIFDPFMDCSRYIIEYCCGTNADPKKFQKRNSHGHPHGRRTEAGPGLIVHSKDVLLRGEEKGGMGST